MPNDGRLSNTQYGARTSKTLLLRLREPDDGDAWSEFIERYAPKIFRWCRRYQLQDSDAADVTQEVLVKLVRTMRDFEYDPARGRFRGWLKTVTGNAVRDLVGTWRKAGRGSGDTLMGRVLANVEDETAVRDLTAELERAHEAELLAEAHRQVEQRVQPHTWEAYRLTAVEQRRAADVAEQVGMTVSEVYVAKSRVVKMLKECVTELMGD